jgi:23S rRNA (guanosine2251-2'-O)-methyltransferase
VRKLTHEELLARRLTVAEASTVPRHAVTVVLQDIRSMYNVGSIFRTADAMRIERIILTGYTPTPPRPEIKKTALGADETVPWSYEGDIFVALAAERARGSRIVALELTTTSLPISSLATVSPATPSPITLVLGNEISGVSDDVLAVCDASVEIPMEGVKHSLNVAVAAGIALYEAIQCR